MISSSHGNFVWYGAGQLLNGPHQVPGGSWIAQCRDRQGAMFALLGPHR
jgi:predicted enzyme related to lactoylglutathione lyase